MELLRDFALLFGGSSELFEQILVGVFVSLL